MDRHSIEQAAQRFEQQHAQLVRKTPLWKLPGAAFGLDCPEVWLKLEQLQAGGSFKLRGMLNRLLSQPIPPSGVIVASGGNAGIATALAAQALGVRCEVYVPELCSQAKRARLRELGADVVVGGASYAEASQACLARQRETAALLTHAYDQPEVVTGAGTLAREIEQQAGVPDMLLVSVGGGGLIAGMLAWFGSRTRVVALEPELAPTLARARQAGEPVDVPVSGVAADALGARRLGSLAWALTQRHLAASILLPDEAILAAQRWLWQSMRLAVEPAAALPLAALQTGAWTASRSERVCLVICGGNLDLATLA
jgi:threonine dehydratase